MARQRIQALVVAASAVLLVMLVVAARDDAARAAQAPKPGGVINMTLREDLPQGFASHETATISVVWPAMPCFSNLVLFDPFKRQESLDTVIPELAERWAWQDANRTLVFTLKKGVKWHDGQPFTSRDVKYTFDMVRGAPDAQGKLRLNPRKDWYANVEAIEAPDPHTVVFRLKRPQPSLVMMLASGYSPVYPAHIPAAEFRTRCVGTGPFKLKEWKRGESIEYVRNPDYFVKGRPYLDGIRYIVITERGTRTAALEAGRLDAAFPSEGTKAIGEQLRKSQPRIVLTEVGNNANDNLLLNATRPPFNNAKLRLAMSLAIDRTAYVKTVAQGSAVVGGALQPKPYGTWGLLDSDLRALPGSGKPADDKARARKLLAEAGYGPSNPLRVEVATRAIAIFVDFASFVVGELKQVGLDISPKQIETAQWHPIVTRKEYQIGANITGIGIDDPDATFYENYGCGSPRNYTGYCNEQVMQLIDQQSQETDLAKRRALVVQIQQRLEDDAARPVMGWRMDHFAQWPHVKNLVPHDTVYNWGRLQEVWIDPAER